MRRRSCFSAYAYVDPVQFSLVKAASSEHVLMFMSLVLSLAHACACAYAYAYV